MNEPQKLFDPIYWEQGMVISQGIYLNMPEEIYFSIPAASVSGLKKFRVAAAKYKFGEHETTRSQALGKLWHTALLEPHELEKRYYVTTLARLDARMKEYQKEEEIAAGREFIKIAEWDEALRMCASIFGQQGSLLDVLAYPNRHNEVSFFWWDNGVFCKGRADILIPEWGIAGDLKSCQDADDDFRFAVKDWRYHWQAAFYKRGLRKLGILIVDFIFFAIEKKKPYLYQPWRMPEAAVEDGERKLLDLLPKFKACIEANFWPGYPQDVQTVDYPESWLRAE